MRKILGLIASEPSYVDVSGIQDYRPVSCAPIFGRYRVIDFMLSNLTNSGIDNINVYIKERARAMFHHITGTSYNINSKKGHIQLLLGEQEYTNEYYNTDLKAYKTYMEYVDDRNPAYVVIAPSHFIFKQDFSEMIDYHIKSKNDVTVLYQSVNDADVRFLRCNTLTINKDKRITEFHENLGKAKSTNVSLEAYVMDAMTFKQLVSEGCETSSLYTFSDILADCVRAMKIGGYKHTGFVACINSLKAYFEANMFVRKEKELAKLINDDWPIYTMTSDSCPTLYKEGAKVQGSIIANGCEIEGTIINSVIGRNVIVKKGAVIKDCVILSKALIDKNVKLENTIVDRMAIVTHVKGIKGSKEKPVYVARRDRI